MAVVLRKRVADNENECQTAEQTELSLLIDQIGELEAEAILINARIKKEQAKLETYKKALVKLQSYADTLEDESVPAQGLYGTRYRVLVGDYGKRREIADMDKLKSMLGAKLFMELATVPLGKIDDYLTPIQKQEVLLERKTSRKLKIVSIGG